MSKSRSFSQVQLHRAYAAQRGRALQAGMLAADFDLITQSHESIADLLNSRDHPALLFAPTRSPLKLQPTPEVNRVGATVELEFDEQGPSTILYRLNWVGDHNKSREVFRAVDQHKGPSLAYWEGEDSYSILRAVMEIALDEFDRGKILVTDSLMIFAQVIQGLRKKKLHLSHDPEHQQFQLSYARGGYFVTWIYSYRAMMHLNRDVRKNATPPTPPGE